MDKVSSKRELKLEKPKEHFLEEVSSILRNLGFKIVSFKNGEEVLAKKGNKLGIRLIGELLAPVSWFPVKVKIHISTNNEINELLFIEVGEDFGIGSLKGITGKYQKYCDDIASKLISELKISS